MGPWESVPARRGSGRGGRRGWCRRRGQRAAVRGSGRAGWRRRGRAHLGGIAGGAHGSPAPGRIGGQRRPRHIPAYGHPACCPPHGRMRQPDRFSRHPTDSSRHPDAFLRRQRHHAPRRGPARPAARTPPAPHADARSGPGDEGSRTCSADGRTGPSRRSGAYPPSPSSLADHRNFIKSSRAKERLHVDPHLVRLNP
jgi:hypothetical protein